MGDKIKTMLFGALICIRSKRSEAVGGLLCGPLGFPKNNMNYTPLALARGNCFYTVIITLNGA